MFHGACGVYPCSMYLHSVLLCCVCLFLNTHIPQVLPSANCVTFIHDWMVTFEEVYAYVLYHMQLNVYFEIYLYDINYHIYFDVDFSFC